MITSLTRGIFGFLRHQGAQTFYHSVFRPVVNNFKTKRAQYQGGVSAPAAPYTTTTTLAPDHEKVL